MKRIIQYFSMIAILILTGCSDDSDSSARNESGDGSGGSLAVFALKGDYLYTVDHADLNVFSLLADTGPVKVNAVQVGFNIETLFSDGNYLYIGSANGMFIYSIENPENPIMLSAVQHITACDPVVANSTHAFVTLHSNTFCGNATNILEVYDTADPKNPVLVHTRNLTFPKGLGLYGHYLFICDDEIKIFDVQNPAEPVLAGSINELCFDVIIKDNDLFAIGENSVQRYVLNPLNISNPTLAGKVEF